ncbi:MAG TPA: ABC transporter ATP-binding protein [Solirubrobacteraceae bacterium]|jgi:iron(III) transport system ATP-binding protein
MSELQITDLHKSYGAHPVLAGVELTVPAGSLTAIVGPSGSGKTTLLRLLAGFQRPDRGTIAIAGRTIDGEREFVPAERRRIGYVPQEGALFPHLTVQANVAFGLPRARRRNGAGDLLEMVGLAGLERRYPHQLSGGQQQRVALARALAVDPQIVLLDEPFASLDAHLRASVREDVNTILDKADATTVLVTHDQDEALSLADRVAVLRDGRIVQCATPSDLYTRPVDQEVARFIGKANVIDGVLDGDHVQTQLGNLPVTGQELRSSRKRPSSTGPRPVSVLIRPEQIELGSAGEESAATGRIVRAGYHGHESLVDVRLGPEHGGQLLVVRVPGGTHVSPGERVGLTVCDAVLTWPA